jgi:hypothetical protein
MHWRTKGHIVKVSGNFAIDGQVRVILPDGRREGVTQLLEALCFYTRQVIGYVTAVQQNSASGEVPAST